MKVRTRPDRPAAAAASRRGVVMPRIQRLLHAEFNLLELGAGFERIDEAPFRRRHRESVDAADVRRHRGSFERVEAHSRARSVPALRPWQGQVNGSGDDIGEFVEFQGALVRDGGLWVSESEPSDDDMFVRARREVSESVEAALDSCVSSTWPGVVAQGASVHSDVDCLPGSEVAGLCLGLPIEPIVVNCVRHTGDHIPQNADDYWYEPAGLAGSLHKVQNRRRTVRGHGFHKVARPRWSAFRWRQTRFAHAAQVCSRGQFVRPPGTPD